MGVVHKITLQYVQVDRNEDQKTFDLQAGWEVEQSAAPGQNTYCVRVSSVESEVVSQQTTDRYIQLSQLEMDPSNLYQLEVSSGDQSAQEPILLQTYENPTAAYDGNTLRIYWSKPDPSFGEGRCLVSASNGAVYAYPIPRLVRGMEIPLPEQMYGENLELDITLKPYIDDVSCGPPAEIPGLCCPRYTVERQDEKARLSYSGSQPGQEQMSIVLEGEIYKTDGQGKSMRPDQPVEAGPLTLGIAAPYTLTVKTGVQLTRTDYDGFVAAVWPLVTARAMYSLLEMIPRCVLHNTEDTLYFHCGLRGPADTGAQVNRRCADVRPGFGLRVEQAQYLPQYQLTSEDAAGFIGVHTADYPVTLAGNAGEEYLSFDDFITGMEEEIYSAGESEDVLQVGAGILDLSAVRMRAAFWRIQYPDAFYSSDVQPDIYQENNTILAADPSWHYAELKNYLLFRGRSALTLLLTVRVNGAERKVPAGTSWGGLLRSMGIWEGAGQKPAWYRRDCSGCWARITGPDDLLQTMPLMNGDRVEG